MNCATAKLQKVAFWVKLQADKVSDASLSSLALAILVVLLPGFNVPLVALVEGCDGEPFLKSSCGRFTPRGKPPVSTEGKTKKL